MFKEKLLLVGAGGFGRMVAEQAMLKYDCAFVADGQVVGTEICGIPVVGKISDLPKLHTSYKLLVGGIGNNKSGRRCMRKPHLSGILFRTSLRPVPISVLTPNWVMAVCFCKMSVSRTAQSLAMACF